LNISCRNRCRPNARRICGRAFRDLSITTWPSRYSTTNCGHSSNRCCPLPNYGEPVIRGASRSTVVRCSPAFSSSYKQGQRWDLLPREMGCGSGMSCWRRLRDWQAAGVWEQLHEVLLARLRAADQIDWSRVIVDSSSIRAVGSGQKQDRIPQTARDPVQSTTSSRKRRASHSR
jgi:transposase